MERRDSPESFKQRAWQPRYRSTTSNILHDFYLPVLRLSQRYDRVAGYFRSTSLAAASQGFSALVRHRGQVRLVVGADVSRLQWGRVAVCEDSRMNIPGVWRCRYSARMCGWRSTRIFPGWPNRNSGRCWPCAARP